jgi:DNA-binding NtrC family response regulator
VAVHCAALSPQLLESELFGHEKGSFTGATERRIGRFEQAQGGTIFLDEVGEIDAATQVKLLRVLGERTLERVGGNRLIHVDVRLIAATHRSLDRLVQEGKFREDLYFRIRVVQIQMPPLRDRPEDIPILAESFRKEYALENGKGDMSFAPSSIKLFMDYRWPGNVRELRTAVEHGVVLAKGKTIEPDDLPNSVRRGSEVIQSRVESTSLRLDKIQKNLIDVAMDKSGKNISKAAQALGISRRTLHRKLAQSAKKGKVPR